MKYLNNNIFWSKLPFFTKFAQQFIVILLQNLQFNTKYLPKSKAVEIFSWKMSNFWRNFYQKCLWPKIVICDILCEIIPNFGSFLAEGSPTVSRCKSCICKRAWVKICFESFSSTKSSTVVSSFRSFLCFIRPDGVANSS